MLIILEIVLRALNSSGRNQDEKLNPIVYNDKTFKDYRPNSFFIRKPGLNDEFGEVEETGILITLKDIYDTKKHRHMDTFERDRVLGSRNGQS